MAQLVEHIAFDLKLFGSIPAFLEAIVGFDSHTPYCPAQSCLFWKKKLVSPYKRLPGWSEFPLMLRQKQSPFAKGGWGLTYANKTREAQVVLAGITMNTCLENGEYKTRVIKQIIICRFLESLLTNCDNQQYNAKNDSIII